MKEVDKKEVISSQSAEFIQQAEEGKFLKLVSDTFIIKTADGTQGYAIRHLNMKDMLLIDTTGKGAKDAVKHLVEEGYKIKGIIVTHKDALRNSYDSLKTISEDAGGAPIFSHPVNNTDSSFEVKDINSKNKVFEHFSVTVDDFPSASGESAVVHSEINEGMVFAGNSAQGAPYDQEGDELIRPDIGSENKNLSLAESWRTYIKDFMYFFPYKGKPKFNIPEGSSTDIIQKLGNANSRGGQNPNL
ncbi:hypothetical protein [Salinimicrobium flavum]|uniref:MBL fold metallo-hydrolase n=1 Tax=Salinimicrobium flavum TaxID=1737065 RepID=A0ABW5IYR9_9FLAO